MGGGEKTCRLSEFSGRFSNDFLDVYYYRPNSRQKEVDFVVCSQNQAVELIQVAYDIEQPKTFDRETSSLVKAAEDLRCDKLTLVAFTHSRVEKINGKTIQIYSALDWLLGGN